MTLRDWYFLTVGVFLFACLVYNIYKYKQVNRDYKALIKLIKEQNDTR